MSAQIAAGLIFIGRDCVDFQCLPDVQRRLHFDGMKMRGRRRDVLKMDAARQIVSAFSQFVGVG